MNHDADINWATLKIFLVWIATFFGTINLSTVVLLSTIVFTWLQIYKLVRDIRRDNKKAAEDGTKPMPL